MNKQLEARIQQRIHALYRYTLAMESGDSDTLAAVLQEAEQDSVLERMILEVNEVYQIEDRTVVHQDDVLLAQELLQETSAEPTEHRAPVILLPTKTRVSSTVKPVAPQPLTARSIDSRKWYRSPWRWGAAAVAVFLIGLLIAPGTGVVASQFLALFRPQQFQAVSVVNPQQLRREFTSYMKNFGDEQISGVANDPRSGVPAATYYRTDMSQAEVEQLINTHVSLPSHLPAGVGHNIQFAVNPGEQGTFTFRSDLARAYLAQTGQQNVVIPAQLSGATFTVKLASGVVASYYTNCQVPDKGHKQCNGGTPFTLAEIPSPVVEATGKASLSDLRSFMLSLPKLSTDMRALLQNIDVNSGVVPIPVPSAISAQQVSINNAKGLLLSDNSLNALIWQTKGTVYMIASQGGGGSQILDAARSLR